MRMALGVERGGQPNYQKNGRDGGGHCSLQEGQRPNVTEQATVILRVMRFLLVV